MFINSKILKSYILFSLLILLNTQNIYAKNLNFEETVKIDKNSSYTFKLNLKKEDYLIASFKSSSDFKNFILKDKKSQIRILKKDNQKYGNIHILIPSTGKYLFKVYSSTKDIIFNFKVNKIIPKDKQISMQKKDSPIISKIIQKQKELLSKDKDTSKFWKMVEKKGTPLIEKIDANKYIVTFLYRGAKNNVRLLGSPKYSKYKLKRLLNSDIWYISYIVPKNTRLSYQLAPDVPNINGTKEQQKVAILATLQKDPLNKFPYITTKNNDKYNTDSSIIVDDENTKDYTITKTKNKGTIKNYSINSKILKNNRDIDIYTPYNFDKNKEFALLFVFDGKAYQSKIPTPTILDNLIYEKKIKQTVAIFIDNVENKRGIELPCNENFAKFMATELYPFIIKKLNKKVKKDNVILTGSSYGGLASMYVAFKYPNIFGNVLSQSGSFWWNKKEDNETQWLTRQIVKEKRKDIKIYLNAGLFETGFKSIDILESNRHLRDVLKAKKYQVLYEEFPSGHDYFNWRFRLANALIKILN
ncbi:hypothetical protein CRV00_08325 [Malaciobacter molluscorum]|uniref:alpha/beta hydrolase-fold protein n=1 Tax=Malaciobacter molluscorum TaxID=1032072 RepID=UPI00100B4964|nr:alpha/beta hydrolase-fold protein [Malaciobacter molluscorum]RXJ94227.1 hypothetical protein CRV00_08325 [Malaciobacter molluscorum]